MCHLSVSLNLVKEVYSAFATVMTELSEFPLVCSAGWVVAAALFSV